jgi:predicted nuclease of predicted toxin-antitoxin system
VKFKLDENLPAELANDLQGLGHQGDTVFEEGLAGAADRVILAAAQTEGRVLLTLDKGIANLQEYQPGSFSGIVLFRPEASGRGAVLNFIRDRLANVLGLDLTGGLVVVGRSRIRIR